MRVATQHLLSVLCLLLGIESGLTHAEESILSVIPSDALGFAVVHNLTDASRSIDEVAKLLQEPPPDLLSVARKRTGTQKGLDEKGDWAIVVTSFDTWRHSVILVPVVSFTDFLAAIHRKESADGIVGILLGGTPTFVGHKGGYAVLAPAWDRITLEQFLDSTTNLASDTSLAKWLDTNKVSIVVTSHGIKQMLPKLTHEFRATEGGPMAEAQNLYLDVLTAAEPEIEQFRVGLRIDSDRTVDLVTQTHFTTGGTWSQWAASAKPATGDPFAGLQVGPFALAAGGVIPAGTSDLISRLSIQVMQSQPDFKFTPEQAQEYSEIMIGVMSSVRSMGMLLGVAEPEAGLYSNTSAVLKVDDSKRFIDNCEKALAASREFVQETKIPRIPVSTAQRITLGDIEALEISTDLVDMKRLAPPGSPDQQKMMKWLAGPSAKLKAYIAPADEQTVVLAYGSIDRLKEALDFYKSKQPGLSADPSVAKVAAALPPGSQFVMYVGLDGGAKVAEQYSKLVFGGDPVAMPDIPDCPPLGFSAKVSPTGAEGHLIITGETLKTISDFLANDRGADSDTSPPQQ